MKLSEKMREKLHTTAIGMSLGRKEGFRVGVDYSSKVPKNKMRFEVYHSYHAWSFRTAREVLIFLHGIEAGIKIRDAERPSRQVRASRMG